jgi:hypothetical protein
VVSKHPSRLFVVLTLAMALVFASAIPSYAQAQRRHRRPVVVVAGHVYTYHPLYYRWNYWGPWWPYRYPPYAYYVAADLRASIRVQVTPRQAQVFVDGYYAGIADEFDGVFQRLRLPPGGHTISLYLEGYRTEERDLYLRPGTDHRLQMALEPLAPGEQAIPPTPPRTVGGADEPTGPSTGTRGETYSPEGEGIRPVVLARYGSLALRVQPADAEILVDGTPWEGRDDSGFLNIRLQEGRHRVEVRKSGFVSYTEDVLIRRDRTLTLNVRLSVGDTR